MKSLTLEDLKPQSGEFFLRKLDRSFKIRPITLADDAWMNQVFGAQIQEKLRTEEGMCRVVFRLLSEEDKAQFAPQVRDEINEDGEKSSVKIGGWKLLMESIEGIAEKVLVSKALLLTRGISNPIMDDIVKEELKKKDLMTEGPPTSVGEPSSTPSPQNTDGPGSKSST